MSNNTVKYRGNAPTGRLGLEEVSVSEVLVFEVLVFEVLVFEVLVFEAFCGSLLKHKKYLQYVYNLQ